ncbi:MAG: FHA domain-containing protein [Gallionella sp.]|nr:FHA domain-containing protein [Gallionella sp.]MDD4946216.1 FHA domain-containing protein [Gallionella sp.]MDD5611678.1 FHA domain-containing protein [Gallionella sp.]
MTAKLILSLDGVVVQECPLIKERVTIGRKAHNDIVINNLAVSGVHAAVVTILNDSFLEDLDSTNGLSVNGEVTKKHFLQNNDVIEIGKYKLKYLNDQVSQTSASDFEKTMMMHAPAIPVQSAAEKSGDTGHYRALQGAAIEESGGDTRLGYDRVAKTGPNPVVPPPLSPAQPASRAAAVQILNGPNAGKELELVKSLTTLGKPGVQVAVLTRRPLGYFITHVEGAIFPSVNGQALGEQPHQLNDHDVIELAGVKMEFYFKD